MGKLTEDKINNAWIQQKSVIVCTARQCMKFLQKVFRDRIISKGS